MWLSPRIDLITEIRDGKDLLGHLVHLPVHAGLFLIVHFLVLCPIKFYMSHTSTTSLRKWLHNLTVMVPDSRPIFSLSELHPLTPVYIAFYHTRWVLAWLTFGWFTWYTRSLHHPHLNLRVTPRLYEDITLKNKQIKTKRYIVVSVEIYAHYHPGHFASGQYQFALSFILVFFRLWVLWGGDCALIGNRKVPTTFLVLLEYINGHHQQRLCLYSFLLRVCLHTKLVPPLGGQLYW